MALQSQLFQGDAKLEAAAQFDFAHIVPGDAGPHVGKIQRALIELDGAAIVQDSIYGPATAAAVLAYKQKRNIINRAIQTQADNIVGKMTMASLDQEMFARENAARGPIRIRPVSPSPSGPAAPGGLAQRANLLVGFKIDIDIPNGPPDAPFLNIRLAPRETGTLEITNGKGGAAICRNDFRQKQASLSSPVGRISQIFDPAANPVNRLDQNNKNNLPDGGVVRLSNDPHIVKIDAFFPGNAFIDATNGTSVNSIALEVRAPKLASVPGEQTQPLTRTRTGADVTTGTVITSQFISDKGSDDNIPGGLADGRPVNPRGGGRKINLGGEGETPGFENYTSDLNFSGYTNNVTGNTIVFRPWTEDPVAGVKNAEASDICIRGVPIKPRGAPGSVRDKDLITTIIRRIAGPGCRLTFSGAVEDMNALKAAFPFKPLEEFADGEIVIPFP